MRRRTGRALALHRGGGAGADGGSLGSAISATDPMLIYMTVELNRRIQEELGAPVADKQDVLALISQTAGIPLAQAQSIYDQGKAKADAGEQLSSGNVAGLILSMTTITEAQGAAIDQERIIELYAELSGVSAEDIRAMVGGG